MEFPFGHHHHHERRNEEEESYPPPPPHHHHEHHEHGGYEHESHEHGMHHGGYEHESHEHGMSHENYERGPQHGYGHHEEPHHDEHGDKRFFSGLVSHVGHSNPVSEKLESQRTVRVYSKAKEDYSLTIREGKVVLAPMDENDPYQHWIKDETYSTRVKDEVGYPAFSLVNKATGDAIKHSLGQSHPVRLVPFNPDYLDESVLWTESDDVGSGFRCIRMVNNIHLNFDAFNGDKDHGGVKDGTIIVLWEWCKGDNQRWKIVPY